MADYAYLNARLRSRRSQLVGEGFFQQALSASFPEFVRLLAETVYGPDLKGDSLGDVDRAVSGHFSRTVGDLPKLVTGELRDVVSLPLLRADLVNLKAILRGKTAGKSPDEIKAGLVGGTLPEALINTMLQAPDAASVAQLLQLPGNPLARALRSAVQGSADLLAQEVALDREFFAAALAKAKKLRERFLASYFALEVDTTNLATAFKLQATGIPSNLEAYFIPGGTHLSQTAFTRIAQGDFAAMDTLNSTPLASAAGARNLGELERALRKLLRDKAHQGSIDSLGPGLTLDYVRTKEWEAARIRLLARRAYYNLPTDAVEREVMA